MTRDTVNSPREEQLVHFEFTIEAIETIKEFDGSEPIGSKDKAVLPRTGTEKARKAATASRFVLLNARIFHAAHTRRPALRK
jgi:hypothetical protein